MFHNFFVNHVTFFFSLLYTVPMSNTTQPRMYLLLGLLVSMLGFFFFCVLDAEVKFVGQWYSSITISFLIRVSASVQMMAMAFYRCFRQKSFKAIRIIHPASQVIRGGMIFCITYLFTKAFILLPLGNTYTVIFTLPLCSAVIGAIFFREHISRFTWFAIILGFIGVLIIVRPSSGGFPIGYVYAALGVLLEAPMFLMIRRYHKNDHPISIIMYPSIFATLGYVVLHSIVGWEGLAMVQPRHYLLFASMGTMNLLAQYCITSSLKRLPTSVSLSMQYTQIVWGILFDIVFFQNNNFTLPYFIGSAIVICSSYIVGRSHAGSKT